MLACPSSICHQAWQQMLFGQADTTDSFLKLTKATPDQEAAHDWINATVEKSWPVLHVGGTTVRHFSKHAEIPVSSKHLKEVMHHLVESVEKAVGDEIEKAPIGSIVHDGWSKVSTHCFGLCACHSLKVGNWHKLQIALLTVSPVQQEPELEASNDDSTTSDAAGKKLLGLMLMHMLPSLKMPSSAAIKLTLTSGVLHKFVAMPQSIVALQQSFALNTLVARVINLPVTKKIPDSLK